MLRASLLAQARRQVRRQVGRRALRRLTAGFESMETRRLMANDLGRFSDEFDDSASLADWSRVEQVEGWNIDQLQVWDVDATASSRMTMRPHTVAWYEDYRGPLAFKSITGDFVVTTRVEVRDRDDVGDSDADDVPDGAAYSLAGLMIRTPRDIDQGPVDWVPGSRLNDGTNIGENYVFLSLGHGENGQAAIEVKTTRNSRSQLELISSSGSTVADLQIARIGDSVLTLYRLPGQEWTVHRRYVRPDLPDTLQVGLVTYSDWFKASDFTPAFHNRTVLAPGVAPNPTPAEPFAPDLEARFDHVRFVRPETPAELNGLLLATQATNAQLLSFLGAAADLPYVPEEPPPVETGSLSGTVFVDANQNGLRDATEGGGTSEEEPDVEQPPAASDFRFVVYDDRLIDDWRPESALAVDWQADEFAYAGDASIGITFDGSTNVVNLAWNGVFPRMFEGYDELRFWVHGGESGGQQFRLGFNSIEYGWIGGPAYDVPAGQWTEIVMPLTAIGDPEGVRSIMFLPVGGVAQPTFYVDEIALVGEGTAADRPAPARDPNFGVNLFFHADWSFDGAFTDVARTFRAWGRPDQPWVVPAWTRPFTEQGVPTEDFGAIFILRGYEGGIYRLRFEGEADVEVGLAGQIVPGSLEVIDGVTYANVEITDAPLVSAPSFSAPAVTLAWRNVSPDDPVRNIQLMAPGHDFDTDRVYRDEFLALLEPFSTVRTMHFTDTNFSPASDWNVRRLPTETIQTAWQDPRGGIAWEHVIAMANEAQKDMWITIPHRADDNYVRELARLWHEQLDDNLQLHVEFSNELWNWEYLQTHELESDFYGRVAPRVMQISQIFHDEWGADAERLEIVLAGQASYDVHLVNGLRYFIDQGLDPSDYIDALAIAPYFNVDDPAPYDDLNELMTDLNDHAFERWMMRQNERLADHFGLKLYAYEGGPHLLPQQTSDESLFWEAQYDPRMGDAIETYVDAWMEEGGGDLFMYYALTGGQWGLIDSVKHEGGVKWDALVERIARTSDDGGGDDGGQTGGGGGEAEPGPLEAGLADVLVFVDLDLDGAADADEPSTRTDAEGRYAFVDLPVGSYRVVVGPPFGWEATGPAEGYHRVDVSAGIEEVDFDFGLVATAVELSVELAPLPEDATEGAAVRLAADVQASGPAGDTTYAWSVFLGDQLAATSDEATWEFVPTDDGDYRIELTVVEASGATASASGLLAVSNVAPAELQIDGPSSGLVRRGTTWSSRFADAGVDDTHAVAWEVRLDGQIVATGEGNEFDFTPQAAGSHEIRMTVTDDDGGATAIVGAFEAVSALLEADPERPNADRLAVAGGEESETIRIERGRTPATVLVRINGRSVGIFPTPDRVVVQAGGGDDFVWLDPRLPIPAALYGEEGDDRLVGASGHDELFGGLGDDELLGGPGHDRMWGESGDDRLEGGAGDDQLWGSTGDDLLLGGLGDDLLDGHDGQDRLEGGAGRDLLIGGAGLDDLDGGAGDDLLVGGSTAYAFEPEALAEILAEWAAPRDFNVRQQRLRGGLPSGRRLAAGSTVLDDLAVDRLAGGAGRDWIWRGANDQVLQPRSEDRVE